jgi:hypothetical protein
MRRHINVAMAVVLAVIAGGAHANGCAAIPQQNGLTNSISPGTEGAGGAPATNANTDGMGGTGGGLTLTTGSGGATGTGGTVINPCGTECGPVELCDPEHLGLDDNCDGQVDEGCPCQAGQAHFCFKGDPSYRNTPGCFDGTELCTEQGHFGPCIGGVHATAPDFCYQSDPTACHAITAPPYANVDLKAGTGQFSANAVAGSESYTVDCPMGVSQCPMVTPPDVFKPLQSGEYTVTYTKKIAGDPSPKTCTFPLLVGAPGLRIELSWEHTIADNGVDLDLHVHQPDNTLPWGISTAGPQDCTWSNCVYSHFKPPQAFASPHWFADAAMPPTPVNWYLDPNMSNNTCYNDPRGVGADWQGLGKGCHNPRLDVDNITCDFSVTDPNNYSFCTPENINIDYPPTGEWTRVGVHYYNSHGLHYNVHPEIKVFCNGALAADLGPAGYYDPETPVTFKPSDGEGTVGNRFWIVADVAFTSDNCGKSFCTVKPVYSDPVPKTPFFTIANAAASTFAPPYPPAP